MTTPTEAAAQATPATPAVEVDELVRRFGSFTAVDGVSFAVEPGELFGFLGPNGAGKTTTISMLCTLLQPSGGRARVAGHDVVDDPDAVRRSIGLVFQETTLDDLLTGAENLRFHGVLYGVPEAEVNRRMGPLLDMVGLTDRADHRVQHYSGGMKRRLEIARGLIHAPRVLFLDEPTIGLDPQTRVHIWDYVETLRKREHTTMFLTTHYMDEAERCDRIAIIDHGRIVAIDTPARLKASVGADTVEVSADDPGEVLRQIEGALGVAGEQVGDILRFSVTEGEKFVPRLFEHADGILGVSVRRPTLDDVFIKYTGHDIRDADSSAVDQFRMSPLVRGFRKR